MSLLWLDGFGAITSLWATYLFMQGNYHGWKCSLVASIANATLCLYKGLFALLVLQVCHIIFCCYGWVTWFYKRDAKKRVLVNCHCTPLFVLALLVALVLIDQSLTLLLTYGSTHPVVFLDTFVAAISLLSQWLSTQRYLICWLGWLISDLLAASLYWHHQVPFHAVLMVCYIPIAMNGFRTWLRLAKEQRETQFSAQIDQVSVQAA
jgi:nicotinamide mononucleotide transporter